MAQPSQDYKGQVAKLGGQMTQTGLWAVTPPRASSKQRRGVGLAAPGGLAEENARLRARVAELEEAMALALGERRVEADSLPECTCAAAPHVWRRLEQSRQAALARERVPRDQAAALAAADEDAADVEELLDALAVSLREGTERPAWLGGPPAAAGAAAPPKTAPGRAQRLGTVEALRARAEQSKRARRELALGADSDAARDRRAARRTAKPRDLARAEDAAPPPPEEPAPPPEEPAPPPEPDASPPRDDGRPAWDDNFGVAPPPEPAPAPAPAKKKAPPKKPDWVS